MCGIVGLITKGKHGFSKDEHNITYQLLYADALRGSDATGVITCHNNGDFGIMKEAVESTFFNMQYIDSSLDKDLFRNGTAMIGHNRAKTMGANEDANAHPFVVDDTFAMVHNGTLRNHRTLADTTVDSEALAITFKRAMDEEDFVKAIEEAVWKVEGAFACVWFDQKRMQVGMIRNSQRPLALVETKGSIVFGSEVGMLLWIASRNGAEPLSTTMVKENVLYLFDVEKGGAAMSEFPLASKPVVIKTMGGTHTTDKRYQQIRKLFTKPLAGPTPCSKNAFKRIRNQITNKFITFTLDDWVEKQLFQEEGDEFILLGSCTNGAYDLCETKHMVQGVVNIKLLGLSIKEMDFQSTWVGKVDMCEYDSSLSQIVLKLSHIIPKQEHLLLAHEDQSKTH